MPITVDRVIIYHIFLDENHSTIIPDIIVKYSEVLLSAAPQHVPEIILKCTGPLLVPNITVL